MNQPSIQPNTSARFTSGGAALVIQHNVDPVRAVFTTPDGPSRFPFDILTPEGGVAIRQSGRWKIRFGFELLDGAQATPGYAFIAASLVLKGTFDGVDNQANIDPNHADTFVSVEATRHYIEGAEVIPWMALYSSAEPGTVPGNLKESPRANFLEIQYLGA